MLDLYLVYVNPIGKNSNDEYEYEFFFSEEPETVWNDSWNVLAPSTCGDIRPDESMYSVVKRLVTEVPLFCAQQNSCFSMSDCKDGILALAWFYDENNTPIIFHYGDDFIKVFSLLEEKSLFFTKN